MQELTVQIAKRTLRIDTILHVSSMNLTYVSGQPPKLFHPGNRVEKLDSVLLFEVLVTADNQY